MSNKELMEWLRSIYMTLAKVDIKSTPDSVKNLSAIYYEIERVMQVLQGGEDCGDS